MNILIAALIIAQSALVSARSSGPLDGLQEVVDLSELETVPTLTHDGVIEAVVVEGRRVVRIPLEDRASLGFGVSRGRLAFSVDGSLFLKDLRTGERRSIMADERQVLGAAWSPQGDYLAALVRQADRVGVSLFDSVTGEESVLRKENVRGGRLIWSPHSTRLVWIEETAASDLDPGLFLVEYSPLSGNEELRPIPSQDLSEVFPEPTIDLPSMGGEISRLDNAGSAPMTATLGMVAAQFSWPVGSENGSGWRENRNGLQWLEPYNYPNPCGYTYHPGLDLNKDRTGGDQDRFEAVYAVADGVVVASGYFSGTWGNIVMVEHNLPDGRRVWSVYGHLEDRWVSVNDRVYRRQQIGRVGKGDGTLSAHLHLEIRLVSMSASSFPCRQPKSYVTERYTNPETFLDAHATPSCGGGSSVGSRINGRPPTHPEGTLIKTASNGTVWLLRKVSGTLSRYGISSPEVLRNPYNQSYGGQQFDFKDVITVADDEIQTYPAVGTLSSPRSLPSNGRAQPAGKLIRQRGGSEIAQVMPNGGRRPFDSFSRFRELGYLACNVVEVDNYYDYTPVGPVVDGNPECSFTLSTSGQSFGPGAGSGSFSVRTQPGCSWSAFSRAGFVTITSTNPQRGDGTVRFNVASNPSSSTRTAQISVADKVFTVTQAAGCVFSISPTSAKFEAGGGRGTVSVTTSSGCAWTVSAAPDWIRIESGNGIGSGMVHYSVSSTSGPSRLANFKVATRDFSVSQSGQPTTCSATRISIGQTLSGSLSASDCTSRWRGSRYFADRFTFSAKAGQEVSIFTGSQSFDTYVYLSGPSGTLIAQDDDSGGGTNSRIPRSGKLRLPSTGTYTIEVTSYSPERTGSYALQVW